MLFHIRKKNHHMCKSDDAVDKSEPAQDKDHGRGHGLGFGHGHRHASKLVPSDTFKIMDRINKAVDAIPPAGHRSSDVIPLTSAYEKMLHNLRILVSTFKKYHEDADALQKSQNSVVKQLEFMSFKTPLYDYVGLEPNEDRLRLIESVESNVAQGTSELGDISRLFKGYDEILSFMSLQRLSNVQRATDAKDFSKLVLAYADEWNYAVTTRVGTELKNVKKLEANRRHYEGKVKGLRAKRQSTESKGKTFSERNQEKLERNEKSLDEAYNAHESAAERLCVLIEEVVGHGWRYMYPLVESLMKWEVNRVVRENDLYNNLNNTLDSMKGLYNKETELVKVTHEDYI